MEDKSLYREVSSTVFGQTSSSKHLVPTFGMPRMQSSKEEQRCLCVTYGDDCCRSYWCPSCVLTGFRKCTARWR